MTNKGLRIEAFMIPAHKKEPLSATGTSDLLVLNCVRDTDAFDRSVHVALSLYKSRGGVWNRGPELESFDKRVGGSNATTSKQSLVHIPQQPQSKPLPTPDILVDFSALSQAGYTVHTMFPQVERMALWTKLGFTVSLQYHPPKASTSAGVGFSSMEGRLVLLFRLSEYRTSIKLDQPDVHETQGQIVRRTTRERWENGDESSCRMKSGRTLVKARLSKAHRESGPVELVKLTVHDLPNGDF
jgi:hypothetical protein